VLCDGSFKVRFFTVYFVTFSYCIISRRFKTCKNQLLVIVVVSAVVMPVKAPLQDSWGRDTSAAKFVASGFTRSTELKATRNLSNRLV